jgi:hypothetical protein
VNLLVLSEFWANENEAKNRKMGNNLWFMECKGKYEIGNKKLEVGNKKNAQRTTKYKIGSAKPK